MTLFSKLFSKTAATPPVSLSALRARATTVLVHYEGSQNDEVERAIFSHLEPILNADRYRGVTYCNAALPTIAPGEAAFGPLLFDLSSGVPTGISMSAVMYYLIAQQEKGLSYDIDALAYWIGSIHGRQVFAILCLG